MGVFLEDMMNRMGFPEAWIFVIMRCVSTISYSILINGESKGMINLSREISQGDSLSLYLFLICAEVLSLILRRTKKVGDIYYAKVCSETPTVFHLFFTDNNMPFTGATTDESSKIKQIL